MATMALSTETASCGKPMACHSRTCMRKPCVPPAVMAYVSCQSSPPRFLYHFSHALVERERTQTYQVRALPHIFMLLQHTSSVIWVYLGVFVSELSQLPSCT